MLLWSHFLNLSLLWLLSILWLPLSLEPLTAGAIQLCVAVKTLYLMSIYTGTMRLNLMFHHWDHCCGARGRGRCLVPGDNITLASHQGLTSHYWHYASLRLSSGPIIVTFTPAICNVGVNSEMVIQNVKGGHTFPLLLVSALLDWPNGLPGVRHSLH